MSSKHNNLREFEKFRVDLEKKVLLFDGEPVQLPLKAVETLCVLVKNGGELVTKEKLLEEVWENKFVEESVLPQNVFQIRKLFKEHGLETNPIKTVPRRGYIFSADIREISDSEDDEIIIERETVERKIYAEISDVGEQLKQEKAINQPAAKIKKNHYRPLIFAAALLALICLAGFVLLRNSGGGFSPAAEKNINSIAVLPLKNLDEGEPNQTLSLGITDGLISRLGSLNRFSVRPLSAVENFTGSGQDALQFGNELKVDAVLVGTIQSNADRLRVSLRLLDTRDGKQIWTDNFDETETDFFKLQDVLSVQVADKIASKLSDQELRQLTRHETENLDAYRHYLKAQFFLRKRTPEDIFRAAELFEEALKLDPNYAAAYTGLADAYLLLSDSSRGQIEPRRAIEKARQSINKSLELNPESAETLATLGLLQFNHDWNIRAADETFRRAINLNPNQPKARHWYGWLLIVQKRFPEAEAEIERASELDPTSRIIATETGYPAFFAGDYERAIAKFREAAAMDKNFFEARFALWRALYQSNRFDEAAAELEAIKNLSAPDSDLYLTSRAQTLAANGNLSEAKRIFDDLVNKRKSGKYVSPLFLTALAAETGDKNAAFSWLEVCFAERNDYLLYLETAPEFENLRGDQRFQKMITRVGSDAILY